MFARGSAEHSQWLSRAAAYAVIVGGFALGFIVFFRAQILSRFDLLFGDRGDTRLVVFIHEHVFQAILGRSDFLSPPFFYDITNTLGYSDAFLLDQIVYAPLRGLGADPFLALLLTIVALSIAGYGFLYAVLRRYGKASVLTAVFSSCLFTFANNLYVNSNHLQNFTIYYVPIVVYLAIYAITEIHKHKTRSLIVSGVAGLLYGLLFPTGFYMAWFFGLGLMIFVPIFILLSWHAVCTWFKTDPNRIGMLAFSFVDGFAIGLIPFAFIYLPILRAGGSRDFSEYLLYGPTLADAANIGLNFVWSNFFEKIGLVPDGRILGGGEQSYALTPGLQLLVILSLVIGLRGRYWNHDYRAELTRAVIIAGAGVYIALFLFAIKIHEHSLFLILTKLVPGARAIRSGYRGMIVVNFFAVISVGLAIGRISVMSSRYNAGRPKAAFRGAIVAALMVLVVVEQVNLKQGSSVSRGLERARFENVNAPPIDCRSFYIAAEPGEPPTILQVDAMLIAQKVGIPTINGYSGFLPTQWDLYDSTDANYEQNARAWAARRGIEAGLCRFEIATGSFRRVH